MSHEGSNQLLAASPVLAEMLRSGSATDHNGRVVAIHSQIPLSFAEALYNFVVANKPQLVVEVGMANGVSTLAILTALERVSGGQLISIDPFQSTQWAGVGLTSVRRSGLSHRHRLIEEPNYLALPALLREGLEIDLAYIDGNHTFDHVILDFFYLDRLLKVGGTVAFNDCWAQAVHKVLNFLLTHRRYMEISVGLPVSRAPESVRTKVLHSAARVAGIRMNPAGAQRQEDRYFRKVENWEPHWEFFAHF